MTGLTLASNNAGIDNEGIGKLLRTRQVKKMICNRKTACWARMRSGVAMGVKGLSKLSPLFCHFIETKMHCVILLCQRDAAHSR